MKNIMFFFVLFCPLKVSSQVSFITENDSYCIWQPGVKLTFEMFKKTIPDTAEIRVMKNDNRQLLPYLGFWKILDVPKKKTGWKKGQIEKGYLCAAFSKDQSCISARDTFDLKCAQLQWDALELGTRSCRKHLDSLRIKFDTNATKTDNFLSVFFMTAYGVGKDFYNMLSYNILHEVVLPRNHEKYLEYRCLIDELLDETSQYATTQEEATRLLERKPLEPYLKEAKQLVGDLRGGASPPK